MRSKKSIINTAMSLLEEFVAIVCSFILPRLILSTFGSAYNGLATSISQFLGCAVLLRSGIGGATIAALYKPFADNNKEEIDSIVKATDIHMKKLGIILAILIILFAIVYPILVSSEFGWFFTFSLFIIIGIDTFAETFFGVTYRIILHADQKLYISSLIKIICSILNVILAVILILCGQEIHIVKLGSALAFTLYPIILSIYVKNKYNINKNVKPNNKAIEQRWDSFWHQATSFINNNTDVIVLTIFTNMLEVSVYSIYNMVISGLKKFITAFTTGIDAAFGNMIAKNEKGILNKNLAIVELIIYNFSTLVYSCAIILILQFVKIYTKGVTDVDYLRPTFAYILLVAQFFYAIRIPYQSIVQASGHFKQTKKYAIMEVILNISISVILVIKYGIVGVAIGTFVGLIYKTITFSNYVSYNVLNRKRSITLKKCLISCCEAMLIIVIVKLINFNVETNYLNWAINGLICVITSIIVIFIGIMLFYKEDFKNFLKILKKIKI